MARTKQNEAKDAVVIAVRPRRGGVATALFFAACSGFGKCSSVVHTLFLSPLSSRAVYYFNTASGQSQWEPPLWLDEVDPTTGAVYYVNSYR